MNNLLQEIEASAELIELVKANGFGPGDQKNDFGYIIPYVSYFYRLRDGKHEYISLSFYEGKFCESVYQIYLAPKKAKQYNINVKLEELQKQGFIPIHTYILRNKKQIEEKIISVSN